MMSKVSKVGRRDFLKGTTAAAAAAATAAMHGLAKHTGTQAMTPPTGLKHAVFVIFC